MKPDEAIFRKHISEANFNVGIEKAFWRFPGAGPESFTWPFPVIWVSAAEKKGEPDGYYFRFTVDGYPSNAPSACPWDIAKNQPLDAAKWPKGGIVTSSIFNPGWNSTALYTPLDRVPHSDHLNWKTEYPSLWWTPSFRIENYLHFLYKNLNSSDYAGH